MIHLKKIRLEKQNEGFPFYLPIFDYDIIFNKPVTIIIGDNGAGKSTLLKIIKNEFKLFQIGKPIGQLPKVKGKYETSLKKPQGFYFSSEDFTTYIYELENEKNYSKQMLKEIDQEYKNKSAYAKLQATAPHKKTLYEISNLHDRDLVASSHGEAYLSFFKSRIRDNQLILLDEPETPLAFNNQLGLLSLINEAVRRNNQVIIVTHSPIIMAYPNAQILEFKDEELIETEYENIENVSLMKNFLNNPKVFFRHLFDEDND